MTSTFWSLRPLLKRTAGAFLKWTGISVADLGIRFHVLLLAITDHRVAMDRTFGILPAHDIGRYFVAWQSAKGSHHFHFFIADTVSAQVCGWLHRNEAKELEQV